MTGRKPPRKPVTTSPQWVEKGTFAPWMMAYLAWLAGVPGSQLSQKGAPFRSRGGSVTMAVKVAKASQFAARKVNKEIVKTLEHRPDAIEYFNKLQEDVHFRARELLAQDVVTNIDARREGLEAARAEKDHKAIRNYTQWVIEDVGFPKKEQNQQTAPVVQIFIGSPQAKQQIAQVLQGQPIMEVEAEIVEPKQLTSGDEDER